MLKKLVKYGNSNALVLDKAIMELLEISEGDTVKLAINNNTLTVKSTSTEEKSKFIRNFATGQEILADMWQNDYKPNLDDAMTTDPDLQDWKPGNKKYDAFVEKTQALAKENRDVLQKINDPKVLTYIKEQVRKCKDPITIAVKTRITEEAYKKYVPEFLEYWKKVEKIREEAGLKSAKYLNEFSKTN